MRVHRVDKGHINSLGSRYREDSETEAPTLGLLLTKSTPRFGALFILVHGGPELMGLGNGDAAPLVLLQVSAEISDGLVVLLDLVQNSVAVVEDVA